MNAAERRERLIRILMLRGRTTAKELSIELEVSERTILRDINILSTSRPIYTLEGRNGGVYITDSYNINRVHMKKYETLLLKKIISDSEQIGKCCLNSSEISMLKEIVAFYSEPKYEKGKKI